MNYLIIGDSTTELIYQDLIDKITSKSPCIVKKQFDASIKEEELFFQSISQNSMFGTRELLVLKRAEKIEKILVFFKSMKKFNILNKDIIIIYNSNINEFKKEIKPFPKKTKKEIENWFEIVESFNSNDNIVVKYIMTKLNIDKINATKFKEMVGSDLYNIQKEIEKINIFLDGKSFSFDEVKNIITVSKEYNIFNLIKELLQGEKTDIFNYLQKSNEHILCLNILMTELLTLLKLRILYEEELITSTNSYNSFKIVFDQNKNLFKNKNGFKHPYVLFLKLPLIKNFDSITIQKHLHKLLDIEYKFKSGNGELDILLELFILGI